MYCANLDLTKLQLSPNRHKIADKKAPLRFYTVETISENRKKTPEGYLLCEGAKLSRTGSMLYKADEVPVTASSDGFVTVIRYEEDVFKESAINSANGKSVVNNHPTDSEGKPVDVLPENWKNYEVGTILHPRRGEGDKKDCLVADLLIKDATAIQLVEDGKVQLSCGYDAEYEEIKPGFAKQYNIIINHVALVDNGRCGPRCSIMDEDTLKLKAINPSGNEINGNSKMNKLTEAINSVRASFKTLDAAMEVKENPALEAILAKLGGIEDRLTKLEIVKVADKKRHHEDDEEEEDKKRRDARKRHHEDDDDDDKKHRDRKKHHEDDDDDDDDDKERDDKYEYTMHYRGAHAGDKKKKKRDDDDDDRKSCDDDDEKKRRDSRKRRHEDDDDDSHMTDKHKKRRDNEEEEEEEEERDSRKKHRAKDSAHLEDTWQETISYSEILVPGIQPPKFVRDAVASQTLDALCQFRKNVLQTFCTTDNGRSLISELHGSSPDFQGMSCQAAKTLFRDCAVITKRLNNTTTKSTDMGFGILKMNNAIVSSPKAMNEYNEKYWAGQFAQGNK